MPSTLKTLDQLKQDDCRLDDGWDFRCVMHFDNMSYVAWNSKSREAIVVDPAREDLEMILSETEKLKDYRFIAVIDTHTHADHISGAAKLAAQLSVPLIMQVHAPSHKVDIRISRDTTLPTAAGPLKFLVTPGHTADCMTPIWGPFIFTGDTLMYGDTGRDDLPTGDGAAHYDSLQKIKAHAKPQQLMLTNHDDPGRVSTWATQLKICPQLTQTKEEFMNDAGAFVGNSPKLLKESLYENFK